MAFITSGKQQGCVIDEKLCYWGKDNLYGKNFKPDTVWYLMHNWIIQCRYDEFIIKVHVA